VTFGSGVSAFVPNLDMVFRASRTGNYPDGLFALAPGAAPQWYPV